MGTLRNLISIYFTEFRSDRNWYLGWIIGVNLYVLLGIVIYPGEQGVADFMTLVQDEYFQALLGDIGGSNPGYALWLAFYLPFIVVVLLVFGLMSGSRLASKPISDGTGEIIHTLPVTRSNFYIARFLIGFSSVLGFFAILFGMLITPIAGVSLSVDPVGQITLWGILFVTTAIALGFLFGMISKNQGNAQRLSLFFAIVLYGLQILSRVVEETDLLVKINPLEWYSPTTILLGQDIEYDMIYKLFALLIVAFTVGLLMFQQKNLVKNTGGVPLHRIKVGGISLFSRGDQSDRGSIFTSWGRHLETRFPVVADFIYSERNVLMIGTFAIFLFYPAQLLAYPGDELIQKSIEGFGGTAFMEIFTYGHDLVNTPYLWFVITQAIGNHYFLFVPLTYYWINKVLQRDGNSGTGEIMGSIPIPEHRVMLARVFAIFLELLFFTGQMVFWLVFSESILGRSYNMAWEIIAIIAVLPLYIFLITTLLSIGLIFQQRGVKVSRIGILVLLFGFIAAILTDELEFLAPFTIFGLYDPVLIITEQSLLVNQAGVIWLSIFSIISTTIIYFLASQFTWLNIEENETTPMKVRTSTSYD